MNFLCVDFMNPVNCPTAVQLKTLGVEGVRSVLFDKPHFYRQYRAFYKNGYAIALVLTEESILEGGYTVTAERYVQALGDVPPAMVLIGNEMNADSERSSWVMTQEEFLELWNAVVPVFKAAWPDVPCFVGGILGSATLGWLDPIWPSLGAVPDEVPVLDPLPDGIDIHYPDSEETIQGWAAYGLPVSNMEWCYAGPEVTRADVVEWLGVLRRNCVHNSWFEWRDIESGMGLISMRGVFLPSWFNLRAAYHA